MDLNLRVIKEPRGFIRVVQFIFAIFAFSTTASFSGSTTTKVQCSQEEVSSLTLSYAYPFKNFELNVAGDCAKGAEKQLSFAYNFSSSAEFFVTTGVLAFLYCLGIMAVYILMNQVYITNQVVPIADLGLTGALTIFWLAGSSAWAQGVSDIKYYSSTAFMIKRLNNCAGDPKETWICSAEKNGSNFVSLNISLILGFANCLLWGASLWFVFKETSFHQKYQAGMQPGQGLPPGMIPQQQQAPMPPQTQPGLQSPDEYKY